MLIEIFDNVFCDSIVNLPQRANDTFEPQKLEFSCKVNDFVEGLLIANGGMAS
jgi:hypothetical protein